MFRDKFKFRLLRDTGFHASFVFGSEDDDLSFSAGLGVLGFRLSATHVLPSAWRERASTWATKRAAELNAQSRGGLPVYPYMLDPFEGRRIGIDAYEGSLVFYLWNNDQGWSAEDRFHLPWNGNGWVIHLPFRDWFFGVQEYERRGGHSYSLDLEFPEAVYSITVKLYETRRNRRWWRSAWQPGATVECETGIPIPGKGENAYDIDDDAIYSLSCNAATIKQAIEVLRESVQRDRDDRGGFGWTPEPEAA